MITLSGILGGVILFTTNGEFLHIAGPAGLLSAIAFVGVTAICVMEGLSEMVVLWPVSNAMVEYVRAFVDEDLAPVVAIAYWFCSPSRKSTGFRSNMRRYTYSSVFATLVIAAANISTYWNLLSVWQTMIFYVICPVIMVAINWIGVNVSSFMDD
jgi:amino acid transporter